MYIYIYIYIYIYFQRNISNYPLNSKSFHNYRYLPFHLILIYNQPTVNKNLHSIRMICLTTAPLQISPSSPN